jgi:hypothetical protein
LRSIRQWVGLRQCLERIKELGFDISAGGFNAACGQVNESLWSELGTALLRVPRAGTGQSHFRGKI